MRQEIVAEMEHVKDITQILSSFKADNNRVYGRGGDNPGDFWSHDDYCRHEEPTRDPDVWPPPTPVEHK